MTGQISIRELRDTGGAAVDRIVRGESLVVTCDGTQVAELRPLPDKPLPSREFLCRNRHMPPIDYEAFRRDIDGLFNWTL